MKRFAQCGFDCLALLQKQKAVQFMREQVNVTNGFGLHTGLLPRQSGSRTGQSSTAENKN
jgi:hypothetical protein